mmetsp:Transcript_28011/g.34003  ORF Transcript_28011/g.34003 Transcript_28011/m.34003 type:complete len:380 (+) Transcript_28011:73-1212(+)
MAVCIPDTEVHKVQGEDRSLLTKATLEVSLSQLDAQSTSDGPVPPTLNIKVGEVKWTVLKTEPTLKLEARHYIFVVNDSFYAVILPRSTPVETIWHLEKLLDQNSSYRKAPPRPSDSADPEVATSELPQPPEDESEVNPWDVRSKQVSDVIEKSASALIEKLSVGAKVVEQGLKTSKEAFKSNVKPSEQGFEVSDSTLNVIHQAKEASATGAALAKDVKDGVISTTAVVAQELAKTIRVTGGIESTSGPKTKAAQRVANASLMAVSEVYSAMYAAGRKVASTAADSVTECVDHRLGEKAGTATGEGLATVGNVVDSAYSVKGLKVSSIAKSTVRNTGKAVILSASDGGDGSATDGAQSSEQQQSYEQKASALAYPEIPT